MRDYVSIGCSPTNESCVQVGDPEYNTKAYKECEKFRDLLRQKFGAEPTGAKLSIKSFPHDFGSYFEVVCWYDDTYPDSIDYAYRCESEAPEYWND